MRGKWLALVGVVVIAVGLVVAALIYVRPRGVRVEVRFVSPDELGMSEGALRAAGLENGGFEVTLRDGKLTVATPFSPANLHTFAEFTEEEGVWLDGVFAKWRELSEVERTDALAKITTIIRRSLTRHGGTLDEYMDERMGLLREYEPEAAEEQEEEGEEEKEEAVKEETKSEIERLLRQVEWSNFPASGPGVRYVPELIPCTPADNAPRRVIRKDPWEELERALRLEWGGAIQWGEPKRTREKPETRDQKPDPNTKPE